jgi:hypothetical protein
MHFNSKTYQTFADHSVYVDGEMIAAPFSQWLENMVNTNTSAYYTIPSDLYLNHRGTTMQLELKSTTLELADILSLDLISSNAERHFYIGAPYTFARLGLYNYLAPTGRSFELSPNKKAAIGQLNTIENIEDLALFSTVAYFDAIGPIAAEEFSLLSFLVINTAPEFRKRQEALVAKIEKQLPVKQVVALENFPLIESVSAFYEVLQPTSCTELQQLFKPLAEDAIFNTSPLSKNLEDQLSKLEHIFSVYAHFRVFDVDKTTESYTMSHTVSPLERNVLVQLESKVEALLKSPAIQHQNWILRRLKRLETAFLQLPMD